MLLDDSNLEINDSVINGANSINKDSKKRIPEESKNVISCKGSTIYNL
jgi:hypothetical protein